MLSREMFGSPVFETESLESFWGRVRQGYAVPEPTNPFCMLSHDLSEGFLECGFDRYEEPSREEEELE